MGITARDEWEELSGSDPPRQVIPDNDEDEVDGVVVEFVLLALPVLLHRQVENPEKKHTEHWIEMAPSDLRSNVAD